MIHDDTVNPFKTRSMFKCVSQFLSIFASYFSRSSSTYHISSQSFSTRDSISSPNGVSPHLVNYTHSSMLLVFTDKQLEVLIPHMASTGSTTHYEASSSSSYSISSMDDPISMHMRPKSTIVQRKIFSDYECYHTKCLIFQHWMSLLVTMLPFILLTRLML